MHHSKLAGLASAVLSLASFAQGLVPITVKGNAFYAGNDRFYIRGVDYQPGGSSDVVDPLSDESICGRDIEYFKDLGINTIRVYTVDAAANHDKCMKMLDDAGIYLVLDVNTPKHSIVRSNPAPSYNERYLQHVFSTLDVFDKYDNTMAYFAGNEVVNDETNTAAATWVKATLRDMKAYQKARKLRQVPIGYSAADVASNRQQIAEYFNSGSDEERADFHAYNDYSWCGTKSSFQISGYDQKVKNYTGYGIPAFMSEFGCNTNGVRTFDEISSIYNKEMTSTFSGGLVFEYSQGDNKFGLVTISKDGKTVSPIEDFANLKSQYAKYPNPTGDGGATLTKGKPSACPPQSNFWQADCKLPDMPTDARKYFTNGAGTPLGLDGPSSQWGGDSSGGAPSGTGSASPASTSGSDSTNAASPLLIPGVNMLVLASVACAFVSFLGGAALL